MLTTVNALPKVRPVSMRDTALSALRQALLSGRFAPGEAMSEPALANEMDISRGPVREALLVLAQEGLVVHSQNYGFSVARFTEADRHEVGAVRYPLETLALELARERITPSDLRELKQLMKQMLDLYRRDRLTECTHFDREFHQKIWAIGGNRRLERTLLHLMTPYFAYASVFRISRDDLSERLLEDQHVAFLDYLSRVSTRSAAECVGFHIGLAAQTSGGDQWPH